MEPKAYTRKLWKSALADRGADSKTRIVTLLGNSRDELEIYDELGIARSNITAIERERERYEVMKSARLGIRLVHASFAEYAALVSHSRTPSRIDAINADFNGSFWNNIDAIPPLLVPFAKSRIRLLAITSLDRRDAALLRSISTGIRTIRTLIGSTQYQKIAGLLSAGKLREHTSHTEREIAFLWWLAMALERCACSGGVAFRLAYLARMTYASSFHSDMHYWLARFDRAPREWSLVKQLREYSALLSRQREHSFQNDAVAYIAELPR